MAKANEHDCFETKLLILLFKQQSLIKFGFFLITTIYFIFRRQNLPIIALSLLFDATVPKINDYGCPRISCLLFRKLSDLIKDCISF